jgi:methylenetetrahydrofolate reductase (NADPH)
MSVTPLFAQTPERALSQCIATLAREASLEINVQDVKHLEEARTLLPAGKTVYVSHLPKQQWADTVAASRAVIAAGFRPVPHIPVRLLANRQHLDEVLAGLAGAGVGEVLLISGDYEQPQGEFSQVLQVLQTGALQAHGITRVSIAGHPEGHPRVALEEIRRAEVAKARYAEENGLTATFVTQFCFESAPFIDWARELRSQGVRAKLVAGVAGPAKLTTLVNFALRCGVGRSIRALSARPGVMNMLVSEHGPDDIVQQLAQAIVANDTDIGGIHVFCLGGFLRSSKWLRAPRLEN